MRNNILIILMVATILLSGCSSKNTNDERKNDDKQQQVEVGQEQSDNEETNVLVGTNKVNFYLFYLSSCSHCHAEREWIASIKDKYPYVNFIMYEATENEELFKSVNKAFDIDNASFPVTIIGNNYMVGYSESKNRKFVRYFEELSTFKNCDVVQSVIDGNDVEVCMKKNENN